MEKQLSQLSPRTRTTDERKKTLDGIQQLVKKEKRREWLKLVSSYAGVAAILLLLFATSLLPPSATTSSGKEVKYAGMHTYEINPWYYINDHGFTLNQEGVKNIAQLAALADQGTAFDMAPGTLREQFHVVIYYLGSTKDESESYALLKPFDESAPYYFVNNELDTYTTITPETYARIQSAIETYSDDYQSLPNIARIIIILIIYNAYLWLGRRLHPDVRMPEFGEKLVGNVIGKTFLHVVALYALAFLLQMSFDYLNIITAFIVISIVSFGQTMLENVYRYYKRNWLEVPLTIFVYTLNLFIFFYN